ncbi:MAG: bifunctional DNA-binding transcriptional regulator/O6-methylguanine-DNA methyltransferase Ada [Bryobacteraceae bacterium]
MKSQDSRWTALVERDSRADGRFVYAVRTTGVYCRPSCGAKLPRRENVRFFETTVEAEAAGFRACLRCRPNEASHIEKHSALVAEACRVLEHEETSLEKLADRAGLSLFHFHRVFKSVTGVTPKQYAMARRAERVRRELKQAASVTDAIYSAGFESSGRFYADTKLGMTPSKYRAGGVGEEIRFAVGECSLGLVLVARTERGICAILMGDVTEALETDLRARFPKANVLRSGEIADAVRLIETPQAGLDLPLDIRGTAFQLRVWQALREIPAGRTLSYTEVAEKIGSPKSVRAVAGACAANAIAVAIPCHRVVRGDGSLSGYRWGVDRKRALLEREK